MKKGDYALNHKTGQIGRINDPAYEWHGKTTILVEVKDDEWMNPWAPEDVRIITAPTDEDTLDGETSWPLGGVA